MEKSHLVNFFNLITYLIILVIIIGLIMLFGTFTRLAPFLDVLLGNDHYSRGEYGQSIINYFKARTNIEYDPYLNFNLGNVYAALGEKESAMTTLHKALTGRNHELIFNTNFNLANLYYESSQYNKAVKHYIEALKANPNAIDAKINLELALKKLKSQPIITKITNQENDATGLNKQSQQILDLVQKREEAVWQTQQQKTPSSAAQNDW